MENIKMDPTPGEVATAKLEAVQDGERFTYNMEKVTKNKRSLQVAKRLRSDSGKIAMETGVKAPEEVIDGPVDEDKAKAERSLEKATDVKATNFAALNQEDIDFINSLDDDESKEITIRELFSERILKKWKTAQIPATDTAARLNTSPQMISFVKIYKENYNRLLEGKTYKTLEEIKTQAGYGPTVSLSYIRRTPWVALKLENYHKSNEQIQAYHLSKIDDQKIRQQSQIMDLNALVLSSHHANPDKLLNANIRDQSTFLKNVNEMQKVTENTQGPAVAIQINSDVANVAMGQAKEKHDFLNDSFN